MRALHPARRCLDPTRRALRLAVGLLAIVVQAGWNAAVTRTLGGDADPPTDGAADRDADDRDADDRDADDWDAGQESSRDAGRDGGRDVGRDAGRDADIVERERNWYDYIRGFHAHHGDVEGDRPEDGSFWSGLDLWLDSRCLRGYTLGDRTFVCSNAPSLLRVHQAGHAPTFGRQFEPIRTERRPDGGLEDEPLRTLDVMLPGDFPHTLFRFRDPRGLGETYDAWLREGRIERR